jgi:uncharacterized protein YyaL (SSP411 family)
MARGGIYDQIGGGFHRYSTDRAWLVPHFEKMLSDNGQLLEVYSRAYAETKDPLFAKIVRETAAFLERELAAPGGAFFAALDADTGEEEGRFYVWSPGELAAALPDAADLALAKATYGADGQPAFEGKYHVLAVKLPPAKGNEDRLARAKELLFAARAKRQQRPSVDTNVLTGWNGLTIAGLAKAGQALGDKELVARAAKAAEFVLKELRGKDGRLLRVYSGGKARGAAYLDDYADLTHGLLTLHEATGDAKWLAEAKALAGVMVKRFRDPDGGGFYYTAGDHDKLFVRMKDQYDGVQPSGNSQAAMVLVRLWRATGDEEYRKLAEETIRALAVHLRDEPSSLATLAEALAAYLEK